MDIYDALTESPPPVETAAPSPLGATPGETDAASVLAAEVQAASTSPVVNALLRTASGLLWVLDRERRVVAMNRSWLDTQGAESLDQVLGLRPGEALHCVHAESSPYGCGTAVACTSCGTAMAIVATRHDDAAQSAECVLRATRGGETLDFTLRVRAQRLHIGGSSFTLLFLDDVSAEHRRAALERAFFHDVNNVATALLSTTECLDDCPPEEQSALVGDLQILTARLIREINVQQALSGAVPGNYAVETEYLAVTDLLDEVLRLVARHPANRAAQVRLLSAPGLVIQSDRSLVERVLSNLLINALEAGSSRSDGLPEVTVTSTQEGNQWALRVWNSVAIPLEIQPRIFQRYFSTKGGTGRGQGLFAAKLFVEQYLGGALDFASDSVAGTTFRMLLPLAAGSAAPPGLL